MYLIGYLKKTNEDFKLNKQEYEQSAVPLGK